MRFEVKDSNFALQHWNKNQAFIMYFMSLKISLIFIFNLYIQIFYEVIILYAYIFINDGLILLAIFHLDRQGHEISFGYS
jgi:maltodextrin utilization protein YvdJ